MDLRLALRPVLALLGTTLVAAAPASTIALIPGAVQTAIASARIPGAQVAIVRNGTIVLDRGFGVENIDTQQPVTNRTHFEIGSVTKQFTAAAILQLAEQGKLKLTDRLGTYVPEYARGKNITLEELMWQVSGIPNYTSVNHFESISGTPPGGLGPALALIAKKPLAFAPGTRWAYSNTNYLLLGAVVARVSHMRWETYVRKNIFARAGMTHSTFIDDEPGLAHMASGYALERGTLRPAPRLIGAWAGSAGDIVSTASDVAKWDLAFFGGKIVSMRDVRLATTAHRLPSGRSTDYGFGWLIDTFQGQPRISHDGGTNGFTSQNAYFPKQHQFVVALINTSSAQAASVAASAFDAMHPAITAAARKPAPGENSTITALARRWLHLAQTGKLDRSQLTPAFSKVLTPAIVTRTQQGLGPLGDPTSFVYRGKRTSNGTTAYRYRVSFPSVTLLMILQIDAKGQISGIAFGG